MNRYSNRARTHTHVHEGEEEEACYKNGQIHCVVSKCLKPITFGMQTSRIS